MSRLVEQGDLSRLLTSESRSEAARRVPTDNRVSHGRRSHDKCHVGLGDSVRNDLRAAARGLWPGCASDARLLLRRRIASKVVCYPRLRSQLFIVCVCCHLICCRNESPATSLETSALPIA